MTGRDGTGEPGSPSSQPPAGGEGRPPIKDVNDLARYAADMGKDPCELVRQVRWDPVEEGWEEDYYGQVAADESDPGSFGDEVGDACEPAPPGRADAPARGAGYVPPAILPDDAPVKALGHRNGVFFYLDGTGQVRVLSERDHAQTMLDGLFAGNIEWVQEHFCEYGKNGQPTDIRYGPLRRALMAACVQAGHFDPMDRIRGRGAWRGEDGQLVLHRGDFVLSGRECHRPGMIGKHLYLGDAPLPRPAKGRQTAGDSGPAAELLAMLRTWCAFRRKRAAKPIDGGQLFRLIAGSCGVRQFGSSRLALVVVT